LGCAKTARQKAPLRRQWHTNVAEIIEEASIIRRRLSADSLARFLGLTYRVRTVLKITTIGSRDFSKAEREKQRRHKDRMYQAQKRRAPPPRRRAA
jgi:hypothetical protein